MDTCSFSLSFLNESFRVAFGELADVLNLNKDASSDPGPMKKINYSVLF